MPSGMHRGILIARLQVTRDSLRGTAGDVIGFRQSDGDTRMDVELGGQVYRDVWDLRLIPFDSSFAPHYVYSVLTASEELFRGGAPDVQDRADLASRARALFAYHPYREHFAGLACRFIHRWELMESDGKTGWDRSRACTGAYLRDFPAGRYRDELEWLEVQLRHAVYEYEGNAAPAIEQVRAYSDYLDQHPRHGQRAEIEFAIARLCYLVYEMTDGEPQDSAATAVDAKSYRARAESIYTRLSTSDDPGIASRAVVQLFNLRTGRRIYGGSNAW